MHSHSNSPSLISPYAQLDPLLSGFVPISLDEMSGVSLLDRVDTKYLMPYSALLAVLEQAQPHYRILDIQQVRLNRYHTIYFDEPDFTFYHQHHNQLAERYKVRARRYVDTALSFFEVKHKNNKKRTVKSRLPLEQWVDTASETVCEFVNAYTPVHMGNLEPKLWNDYVRLTLVGIMQPERVTIDLALSFGYDQTRIQIPKVAIAEVKQAHLSQSSPFIQMMRRQGIRSVSFSKYCAGVFMLHDGVKTNNFKPVMRLLEKLSAQGVNHAATA
ncbi:MAG: polyphosphate polymerase domain-containing protein [Anaerolineae bacterium]|nr:polyphosphate polymerase domain-containing protein [Anaerolineae bacterium]